MSLFAFLGGRHDKKAWGRALFAAGFKLPEKPDVKRYEKLTAQLINADCRAIRESADVIMKTNDPDLRRQKHMILYSRYARLSSMEPYADHKQKQLIKASKELVAKARKFK